MALIWSQVTSVQLHWDNSIGREKVLTLVSLDYCSLKMSFLPFRKRSWQHLSRSTLLYLLFIVSFTSKLFPVCIYGGLLKLCSRFLKLKTDNEGKGNFKKNSGYES